MISWIHSILLSLELYLGYELLQVSMMTYGKILGPGFT